MNDLQVELTIKQVYEFHRFRRDMQVGRDQIMEVAARYGYTW
jgi:hypothetical protein